MTAVGSKKYTDAPIRISKSVTIRPFVLTQHRHWTDRQTDRQTELVKQYRAVHALHADARLIYVNVTTVDVEKKRLS